VKRRKLPKAVAANPHVVRALEDRFQEGKRYEAAKNFLAAEKIYREVVNTYVRHGYSPAVPNAALGYALLNQRKFEEAEKVLKTSASQDPTLFHPYANLGALYATTRRWKECAEASSSALKLKPQNLESLLTLAEAQKETKQYALSVQNFLLALSLDKDNVVACKGLASAYYQIGEPSVAIPMFRRVLQSDPEAWASTSFLLFVMQYEPALLNQEVLQEHVNYGNLLRQKTGPARTNFTNSKNYNRRLRIGYLSADFYNHVVMRFAEQVFAHHDHTKFEVVMIAANRERDAWTDRIKTYANRWVDISQMTGSEAKEAIYGCELDIIIDLAGHSGNNHLALLASRLAPVQITWLGYSGTTGLDVMDYIIVDNVVAPPGEPAYFAETPIRLPHSYLCFQSPDSFEIDELPFSRTGYITFGCMNNPAKINKYVVSWWAKILEKIPNSKMLLRYGTYVDPLVRERIAKMFRECNVSPERYQMLPGLRDFGKVYNDVDIALDTFPYNGTTTTCEALWMGVPVIAIRGDRFVSRVSASVLTNSGLDRFIAESAEEYIDLAVRFAKQPDHLTNLRQNMRANLSATPVYDAQTFTKGLENAYVQVFQHWCDGKAESLPAA